VVKTPHTLFTQTIDNPPFPLYKEFMKGDRNMSKELALRNIGTESIDKGFVREGIPLAAWDGLKECSQALCPIFHRCSYVKDGIPPQCEVQKRYVVSILERLFRKYRYLDEASVLTIGMQIVPLYSHLAQLQIIELSLHLHDITGVTDKGSVYVHPIYKEIRETMKTIHLAFKTLGIEAPYPGKPDPDGPDEGDAFKGDPSYYRKLKDSTVKKGVVR